MAGHAKQITSFDNGTPLTSESINSASGSTCADAAEVDVAEDRPRADPELIEPLAPRELPALRDKS